MNPYPFWLTNYTLSCKPDFFMQCPTETIPTKCKQCRKILYHCCCNILYCRKEALKSRVLSFSLTTLTFDNKIRRRRSEIMGSGYDASMPISSILLLAKLSNTITN